ncbi:MAG: DEAD/DEAH box helicase [Candidatus Thermoplasmatota archaeon]
MNCEETQLSEILIQQMKKQGFEELTAIQEKCIPEILRGRDLVGQAETGSGKTLAFSLPILNNIRIRQGIQALILTPTRELCVQVSTVLAEFGKKMDIHITSIFGGVNIGPQIQNLRTSEIVVGTPGRILDHVRRKTIDLSKINILVLDETDKMFEMGFIDDVEEIIKWIPNHHQTLMFSATLSSEIQRIIHQHLQHPCIVRTRSYVDHRKLKQIYYDIYPQNNKFSLLVHLLKNNTSGLAIVFCSTRRESDVVAKNLRHHGIKVSKIHGGMGQQKRLQSLTALKNENVDVLVATDVAARGLDIKNVTHIYNYDVPKTATEYVHRIGRTARAGAYGSAITLLTERDYDNFRRIQSDIDLNIERAELPDFRKVSFIRQFEKQFYSSVQRRSCIQ